MSDTRHQSSGDVAIVGYAARLPGAAGIAEVWDTLINGRCEVGPIPSDRWSSIRYFDANREAPGKTYAKNAGLIDDVFDFDAGYFGLSPREAEQMDPQQRKLLETVALAFDHSGIDPERLNKERTGVFVGAASSDHSTSCLMDPAMVDAQYMLGNTLSIISNRISYQWDIQGPSYTVDTACSSGLYALDHARRAIASGEIDTAIVGSVNMLLSPMPFIGFAKASMLSATGLCQAFGRGADGYARAEGAVVFILRSSDLARTSHNRIRSYLAATGTNSDGKTPGIAMPSSVRQLELLQKVKRSFGISPEDLAFVEAHGTGTPVGDPEEARAIGLAYGQERSAPLPIGSAKTNFGHLEPAAGLVGLLKAQLALENGILPASLHAEELNPDIPFEDLGLDVVREARELPKREQPWLAAVNSFGFGGANAHAILRQASPVSAPDVQFPKSLMLTAESQATLRGLSENWRERAEQSAPDLAQATVNANTCLARHRHRLCVPAATPDRLAANLNSWLEGHKSKAIAYGLARNTSGKVGFVFSGNGSQWAGMGRYLLLNDAKFRESFGESSELAVHFGSKSLLELIMSPELDSLLDRAPFAQPLLLAVQIAMVDALAAKGLSPAAVLGHSAGEVAAAYACGAITRKEAVRIIVARSYTLDQLFNTGTMAALVCDESRATEVIGLAELEVDIAAENSKNSLTVSGKSEDITHLLKLCRRKKIAGKQLQIEYPYHSTLTEPLRSRLVEELNGIVGKQVEIPFYSGCMGHTFPGDQLDTEFWWQNARNKVRFRECIEAMAADGISVFLEISPKSVLQSYIRDCLDEGGFSGTVLGSLERVDAEQIDASSVALNVLAHGGKLDEDELLGTAVPFAGGLPAYPFERKTHRMSSSRQLDLFGQNSHHPLLGGRVVPDSNVWTAELSLGRLPWLADHKVDGRVLLPATAVLEMFLTAATELSKGESVELRDLEILRPIQIGAAESLSIRVSHDAVARRLTLETWLGGDWVWVAGAALFQSETPAPLGLQLTEGAEFPDLYASLADLGLEYGEAFARAERLSLQNKCVDVQLAPTRIDDSGFNLDPTSIDAALHAVLPLLEQHHSEQQSLFVPGRMGRVRWYGPGEVTSARLTLRSANVAGVCIDVQCLGANGETLAEIQELWMRPMPSGRAKRNIFWDERMVSLGDRSHEDPIDIGTHLARDANAPPTDLEVLRDTIGGRLAWDIVTTDMAGSKFDSRFDAAFSALEAMDLLSVNEAGAATMIEDCPWPDMPTLLKLLVETMPNAVDEIQATLHGMISDRHNKAPGTDCAREASLALLEEQKYPIQRALVIGRIDPAVFQLLLAKADCVVVAAENQNDAEGLRLTLDGADRCLVTTVDELINMSGFDLAIGVGVAEAYSPRLQKRLAEFASKGGRLMLVDQSVDLFEIMTGRYDDIDTIEQLDTILATNGVRGARVAWSGAENVSFFVTEPSQWSNQTNAAVNVHGSGEFADKLRSVIQSGEMSGVALYALDGEADLLTTMLSQSEAMRQLPSDASVVWVVQNGFEGEASLRGWRRVLVNETGRDIRCMSVSEDADPERILRLVASSREHELSMAPEGTFAPRILQDQEYGLKIARDHAATLTQSTHGRIETLKWTTAPRSAPEAGEIELAVEATALNFRDVMWAQGLLPSDMLEGGFAGPTLGMECSGTVTRAGEGTGIAPGDRVLAFAPDAFSSHITVSAKAVVAVPTDLDLALAASIPVIFVTTEYSLNDLARLRQGEWCLIHGGAGGVGLAAIQVAKRAKARIIATAGSEEKRTLLRSLGVEHVCDSRSLEFCDYVDNVTNGRGVDVVLNSLAGEAMEQGIACLAPFGRFIELGKRDFVANTAIGLRALKNNISYFAVDADQLHLHRPDLVGEIMGRIVDALSTGDYKFPPVRRFPAELVGDAFRLMQRSGHIGKILVTPPNAAEDREPAPADFGGSWLISGGTKGFGLATAKWLAGRGATKLWLVSRSGEVEDSGFAEGLADRGVRVEIRAVNLTDEVAVNRLMNEIAEDEDTLTGIVNGAAIFDDAKFIETDAGRLERVIRAKLVSAQLLDRASRRFDIRHFWLYSSIASRFGNPGQAAYVAANLELEALAKHRVEAGLPGLAVSWGPIGDVGYLDRSDELKSIIERTLGHVMPASEALEALAEALNEAPDRATITIAPVDWSRLKNDLPVVSEPLFECIDIQMDAGNSEGQIDLAALVESKGETKARKAILDILQREAAQIMRIAPSEIDVDRQLIELGFDSLMGMSLKLAMEERLGTATPMTSIADGMTLRRLAHTIVGAAAGGTAETVADTMAERHLTDSDIPMELRQEIANVAAG